MYAELLMIIEYVIHPFALTIYADNIVVMGKRTGISQMTTQLEITKLYLLIKKY